MIRINEIFQYLRITGRHLVMLFTLLIPLQFIPLPVNAKGIERVIALSPHSVEMLFEIGVGEKIVGTVDYADYPNAALKIPRIGNHTGVQIERVVELEPDLIIGWRSGNKSRDLEKLESLGYKIYFTHPGTIADISQDILALGRLTDSLDRARQVADRLNLRYEKIKRTYADRREVRVFYQLWHKPMQTVGPSSWIHSLIKDCRGRNLFSDASTDYPLISMESAVLKNPEVIIIPHHSGGEGSKREIWKDWGEIEAVKKGRIITLNGDLLHRFGPRAIDGLEQLCKSIDSAR